MQRESKSVIFLDTPTTGLTCVFGKGNDFVTVFVPEYAGCLLWRVAKPNRA